MPSHHQVGHGFRRSGLPTPSSRSWLTVVTPMPAYAPCGIYCLRRDTVCLDCTTITFKMLMRSLLEKKSGPRCFWRYLYHSALVLAQHPTAEIVTTEAFILDINDCYSCPRSMRADMLEVGAALRREINKVVRRVSLILSYICDVQVQWCMLIPGRLPYPRLFPWNRRVASLPLQID